jgi:hypothetical protein
MASFARHAHATLTDRPIFGGSQSGSVGSQHRASSCTGDDAFWPCWPTSRILTERPGARSVDMIKDQVGG